MNISIKIPDTHDETDVQPYVESTRNEQRTKEDEEILNKAANVLGKINKIGYDMLGKHLVSIEKKDGYLNIEIDEKWCTSIEKRG